MYTISYPSGTVRKDGAEVTPGPEMDAYVEWLRAGNGPDVVAEAPTLPRIEVSAWKLIQALAEKGWLEMVESAVAASADPLVQYGWKRAPTYFSDQPLMLGLAAAIGKTREEVQQLFELAASK